MKTDIISIIYPWHFLPILVVDTYSVVKSLTCKMKLCNFADESLSCQKLFSKTLVLSSHI